MRTCWITGPALAVAVLALLPSRAYAHHCDTAQHCFESGQPAAAWVVVFGVVAFTGASIAFDIIAPAGFLRGAIGAVTGRDPLASSYEAVTGLEAPGDDRLQSWERVIGMIPGVGRAGSLINTGRRVPRYVDETIEIMKATGPSVTAYSIGDSLVEAIGALSPTSTVGNQFKVRTTGPVSHPVRGGGEQLWADGIREDNRYLQNAKYEGSPEHSPFADDSRSPSPVRDKIRQQAEDKVYKYGRIIKDPNSHYRGLEYITNDEGAKRFYEDLFRKHDVPGRVRVEE